MSDSSLSIASRSSAFAAAAALSTTQDVVPSAVLPSLTDQADAGLVAEETLSLIATVTARALEVGLRGAPDVQASAGVALAELPYLYHDFLLGAQVVASGGEGEVEPDQSVYERLDRKMAFYTRTSRRAGFRGRACSGRRCRCGWAASHRPSCRPRRTRGSLKRASSRSSRPTRGW